MQEPHCSTQEVISPTRSMRSMHTLPVTPTMRRRISFPIACLVPVWLVLTRYLFIADPSVGTHIMFAAFPCFSQTVGALLGGCMSSLCKLIGGTNPHSSTTLAVHCVLIPLGLAPLAAVRCTASPPLMWVDGLFLVVMYGTSSLLAYSSPSVTAFWNQYIVYLLLSVALSSAAILASGLLVPVLATRQLARAVARLLTDAADALGTPGALAASPQATANLANPASDSVTDTQQAAQPKPSKLPRMPTLSHLSKWSLFSKQPIQDEQGADGLPVSTKSMPALANRSKPHVVQDHNGDYRWINMEGSIPAEHGTDDMGSASEALLALDPPVRLNSREWAAVNRLMAHAHVTEQEQQQREAEDRAQSRLAPSEPGEASSELPTPTVINEDLRQQEFLQLMQQVTEPRRVVKRRFLPSQPQTLDLRPMWRTVKLRPQLAAARKMLGSARLEPPPLLAAAGLLDRFCAALRSMCLPSHNQTEHGSSRSGGDKPAAAQQLHKWSPHRVLRPRQQEQAWPQQRSGMCFDTGAWQGLLQDVGSLQDHLAALEAVASDVRVALALVLSRYGTGPEHCHAAALYTAVQAALKDAARTLRQHARALMAWSGRAGHASPTLHYSLAWHEERVSAAALLHIQAYWAGVVVHTTAGEPVRVHHTEQWRALHFAAVASLQLLRQLQQFHPRVAAALGRPPTPPASLKPASATAGGASAPKHAPNSSTTGPQQPHQAASAGSPEAQQLAPGNSHSSGLKALVSEQVAWLRPVLPMLYGRDVWTYFAWCGKTLVATARGGRPAVRAVLRDRQVQWGMKYWCVQAVVLAALFVALAKGPRNLFYSPFVTIFMYIASAATMSEKVETTISKTILRVLGTAVGALIGWGLMYHHASANSPYAVVAVVVGMGALLSLLTRTTFKYSAMLTQATLTSVVLCQYCGQHCARAGSTKYMVDRLVLVSIGCVLPVLVSQLIAPWYLSSWALEKLAGSYVSAAQLLVSGHQQFRSHLMGETANGSSHIDKTDNSSLSSSNSSGGNSHGSKGSRSGDSGSNSNGTAGGQNSAVTDSVQQPLTVALPQTVVATGSNASVTLIINPAYEHPAPAVGPQDAQAAAAPLPQPQQQHSAGPQEQQQQQQQQQLQHQAAPQQQRGPSPQQSPSKQQQPGPAPQETGSKPLQLLSMLGPLTAVSEGLARDAPLWQRGVLATPPLVHELMAALALLADRMAALQVALAGAGSMSRSFSGWVAQHFLKGIDDELTQVVQGMLQLAQIVGEVLQAKPLCTSRGEALARLQQQLAGLMVMRAQVHTHLAELRHAQHQRIAALAIQRWAQEQREMNVEHDTGSTAAAAVVTAQALQQLQAPTAGSQQAPPSTESQPAKQLGTPPGLPLDITQCAHHEQHTKRKAAPSVAVGRGLPYSKSSPNLVCVGGVPDAAATSGPSMKRSSLRALVAKSSMGPRSLSTRSHGSMKHAASCGGDVDDLDYADDDVSQVLEELMGPGNFHPSDTVAWMACLYALARVLDAALQVGRTAAEAGSSRHGPHAMRAADIAAQSWTAWFR